MRPARWSAPTSGTSAGRPAMMRWPTPAARSSTVAARSPEQRANARCAGCRAAPLTALPTLLPGFDAVINTVPAPVLPRALLQQLPGGALIIDLASLPGGTDFAAAEELGLHAEHALALPGRCAPQTAGALIAQTVLAILEERDPDEKSTAP